MQARLALVPLLCGIIRGSMGRIAEVCFRTKQLGKPIGEFQAISMESFVDMMVANEAARQHDSEGCLWLKDQGRPYTIEASMATLFASEQATRGRPWKLFRFTAGMAKRKE